MRTANLSLTKSLIISALALVLSFDCAAQTQITGSVRDASTDRALEFVNVTLFSLPDSGIVSGQVSDKDGKFGLNRIRFGRFFVRCSLIGYRETRTSAFAIDSLHSYVSLGAIFLRPTPVNLDEVIVTGEKSLFNLGIDRKVYNVDQDLMSKAGSASELLQNIPSVQVDLDGNVSLRGSPSVQITVNGKSSTLMDKSSAVVLQQMPANTIERIEVITNPSAKYKPEGTSGIINIVLKKNASPGLNGNITGNAGNNGRYNANVTLNDNPGDVNFFVSYSIRKDNRNRATSDVRAQADSSSALSFYNGDLQSLASPLSNIGVLGVDYHLTPEDQLGLSGDFYVNTFTRTDHLGVLLHDNASVTTGEYVRTRVDPEYERNFEGTAYFEHDFAGEDHRVRLELYGSTSPEQEDNHYTNLYLFPQNSTTYDNTLIKQKGTRKQISLEYSGPLSEKTTIEAGYSGDFRNDDFDFRAAFFDPNSQSFTPDTLKTNRFLYEGDVNALYATWKQSLGSFGFQAGLRGEIATNSSHLVTRDSAVSTEYSSLYPSLHLSYSLSSFTELQLSYSRRTNRPHGDDLNPFPEYRDPRNISSGNPYLLPEYIHSLELGCQFQNDVFTFVPAVYYRATSNKFTSVIRALNDSTLLTTRQNLSRDKSGGVEMILSVSAGSVFTAHWSANGFYEQIDASNLGYSGKKSTTTWTSNLTFSVSPMAMSKFQVNSTYNASRLTPQGKFRPSYAVNMGFKQELLEGKLSLLATISDLFRTQKRQLELTTPILNQTVINTRDSRVAYLGLTYHFGSPPKKSKEEQLHYENGD